MDELGVCRRTRTYAIEALEETLREVLSSEEKVSEALFRDKWLAKLRKVEDLYPDGWYTPPPNGLGVVFGTEDDNERLSFNSLRLEKNWPRDDIYLDKKRGIFFVYASPVDKKTGIIGDIGVNIYLGRDATIVGQIKTVYQKIIPEIFEYLQVGMELREVYEHSIYVFKKNDALNSGWVSVNDPTGMNCGHTVTLASEWTDEERKVLDSKAPWSEKADLVAKKRHFVNSEETLKIKKGMIITIEQGPKWSKQPTTPVQWYHTMVFFHEDGSKELVVGYEEIFKIAGMNYLNE